MDKWEQSVETGKKNDTAVHKNAQPAVPANRWGEGT